MYNTEDEQKNKKKKNTNNTKIIILLIIVLFLTTFFITKLILSKNEQIDYTNMLQDSSKDIVYSQEDTKIKDDDQVPVININNKTIKKINEEISNIYDNYLGTYTDGFTYEYNVSGDILSILITSHQRYHDDINYNISYKTYNIDLNTLKTLTKEDLLKKYDLEEDKVRYFITYKFVNYYNDLLDKKYFTEKECDFDCFIETKNIYDYMEGNEYYINNNHLEVYKYFNIFTKYNEQKYFTEDSFHFVIT